MVCDGQVSDRRQRTVCYLDKINKETRKESKVKKSEKDRVAKRRTKQVTREGKAKERVRKQTI